MISEMGCCTKRSFLLSICLLQMVSVAERQVFDFLGYLWVPIIMNFFEFIFVIFGFFGAFQYQAKYLISYTSWHIFWLGWNLYVICSYLDLGNLNHKSSKVLKLDPHSFSWWINGPGCKSRIDTSESFPQLKDVTGCLLDYRYVEVVHAAVQCFLAFFAILIGFCLSIKYNGDIDNYLSPQPKKTPKAMSLYSIEFSPQLGRSEDDSDDPIQDMVPPMSPKPMTPRKVKRRSIMQRDSTSRYSTMSRQSTSTLGRHSQARTSTRSFRRVAQNPVTKIMDQQKKQFDNKVVTLTIDQLPNLYSNISNDNLIPIQTNYRTNNGHANPTYQQSSTQSLNEQDDFEELYNNRPASVRSSYSNFHGTRELHFTNQHYYHSHATPQVPQKRGTNSHRQSLRTTAFLNNGPPAYHTQDAKNNDFETTI